MNMKTDLIMLKEIQISLIILIARKSMSLLRKTDIAVRMGVIQTQYAVLHNPCPGKK